MGRDQIKLIAILTMTGNHFAHIFLEPATILYELLIGLGYLTAPVMCLFLVEGYEKSSSRKNYALRIFITACLAQLPYQKALGIRMSNILFTLCICMAVIYIEKSGRRESFVLNGFLILASAWCDWGAVLPLAALWFVRAGEDKEEQKKTFGRIALIILIVSVLDYIPKTAEGINGFWAILIHGAFGGAGVLLGGLLICCFYQPHAVRRQGIRKKASQWFFYLYYPLHLAGLAVLSNLWGF